MLRKKFICILKFDPQPVNLTDIISLISVFQLKDSKEHIGQSDWSSATIMYYENLILLLCWLAIANSINVKSLSPNIIILLADDMGWGDLGANLPHLPSSTPFLDSLANKGVRWNIIKNYVYTSNFIP